MSRALTLARKGEGTTAPNPPVGAIIVKCGHMVAEGYHKRAGTPHAEIVALDKAGRRARGATLYVTLEPCSTSGRTAPCTDSILAAGIKKIVIGTGDPNPRHRGKGIAIFKKNGIGVTEKVLQAESKELIRPFEQWIRQGRPFLTLKMGMSLDGKIADRTTGSKWITCVASRKIVQQLRNRVDAIMVGSGTAQKDNPSLLATKNRRARRIIVDSTGKISLKAVVLNDGEAQRTIIATTSRCPESKMKAFQKAGATVWILSQRKKRVSLSTLARRLGKEGFLHVLCEGGGELAAELIEQQLVDQYLFFIAPVVIGGKDAVSAVEGKGWTLSSAPRLDFVEQRRIGSDLLVRALPSTRRGR